MWVSKDVCDTIWEQQYEESQKFNWANKQVQQETWNWGNNVTRTGTVHFTTNLVSKTLKRFSQHSNPILYYIQERGKEPPVNT